MAKQIQAETLREWLESQQPVTVVDIRTNEDRAQWAIPGSVHVNAYEALREGRPGALTDAAFPPDRPVVTVCNAGRVSETAAQILAGRGFDARTLAGGMKAWSLAWNIADIRLSDPSVQVIQVRRTGKGCLSYVVGSGGQAAVIDPSVSPEVYVAIAKKRGWSVRSMQSRRCASCSRAPASTWFSSDDHSCGRRTCSSVARERDGRLSPKSSLPAPSTTSPAAR